MPYALSVERKNHDPAQNGQTENVPDSLLLLANILMILPHLLLLQNQQCILHCLCFRNGRDVCKSQKSNKALLKIAGQESEQTGKWINKYLMSMSADEGFIRCSMVAISPAGRAY